jgi:hypothetical protein
VIAFDEPGEGWYEAVVVEIAGDMLTMRWRDYPRERRFNRHRFSVGLLYPYALPATDSNSHSPGTKAAKPKHSETLPSAKAGTVFPKTWATSEATAPGSSAAATIRSFSETGQRRRRCTDMITSTRVLVLGLSLAVVL